MPDVKHHPNQESKSGKPAYASPVKKNSSTNDPRQDSVVGGVEEKMRKEILKKKKSNAKDKLSGRRSSNSNR